MSQLDEFTGFAQIAKLEEIRNSRVLVLAASHLEMEILPNLYEQCREIGKVDRLDVVLQCRGGVVNGARRIALLLRQFTRHLGIIVPYHCESSSTIVALAADEIIAGELALFSPIDPHLHGGGADDGNSAFSCMDIKMFGAMSEEWFGVNADEARTQSLSLLCNSIFPPSLTAFYRSTLELQQIGAELLRYQLPDESEAARQKIVHRLMFGYHSHNYALTPAEMEEIGLNLKRQPLVEDLAWEISKVLQATVGGSLRQSVDEPWNDVLLATRDGMRVRKNQAGGLAARWTDARFSS